MAFIYFEQKRIDGGFDPYRYNGANQYGKHLDNLLYLQFIATHRDSTFNEKRQAESEIVIAKRKMKYWKQVADSQGLSNEVLNITTEVKKQWRPPTQRETPIKAYTG